MDGDWFCRQARGGCAVLGWCIGWLVGWLAGGMAAKFCTYTCRQTGGTLIVEQKTGKEKNVLTTSSINHLGITHSPPFLPSSSPPLTSSLHRRLRRPLKPAYQPPRMNHSRQPSQYRQRDINQEVGAAPALEEDGQRRQEEREEVEADVGLC